MFVVGTSHSGRIVQHNIDEHFKLKQRISELLSLFQSEEKFISSEWLLFINKPFSIKALVINIFKLPTYAMPRVDHRISANLLKTNKAKLNLLGIVYYLLISSFVYPALPFLLITQEIALEFHQWNISFTL